MVLLLGSRLSQLLVFGQHRGNTFSNDVVGTLHLRYQEYYAFRTDGMNAALNAWCEFAGEDASHVVADDDRVERRQCEKVNGQRRRPKLTTNQPNKAVILGDFDQHNNEANQYGRDAEQAYDPHPRHTVETNVDE